MKASRLIAALMAIASGAAFAQSGQRRFGVQRNINQQQRIEQGCRQPAPTCRAAEKGESRVENMEARALRDGQVIPQRGTPYRPGAGPAQRDIYREKHDAQVGKNCPPQRMQADVARNINQQQRIAQGVRSGQLDAW